MFRSVRDKTDAIGNPGTRESAKQIRCVIRSLHADDFTEIDAMIVLVGIETILNVLRQCLRDDIVVVDDAALIYDGTLDDYRGIDGLGLFDCQTGLDDLVALAP